ncbi:MAG TPA: hypothetical protein VEA59_03585 [Patescibacteria group bacterium]|nr:hypothetical protein [Patescibacteria group bacterium]
MQYKVLWHGESANNQRGHFYWTPGTPPDGTRLRIIQTTVCGQVSGQGKGTEATFTRDRWLVADDGRPVSVYHEMTLETV